MDTVTASNAEPNRASGIAGEGDALWFLDNLAKIRLGTKGSAGSLDIVEVSAREGDMPPLHVHHREDEYFVVIEGEITLHMPGASRTLAAGEAAHAPRGVPHTYRIESAEARWYAISNPSGFAAFVATVAEPAPVAELPTADRPVDMALLGSAAEAAGIEILGAPGTLP